MTERIRKVGDSIRDWIAIDDSALSLSAQSVPDDPLSNVRKDTHDALDATQWIPADHDGAAELATRLRRQERILKAFNAAHTKRPDAATGVYDKKRVDADSKPASTDDELTAALIGALERVDDQPLETQGLTDTELASLIRALTDEAGNVALRDEAGNVLLARAFTDEEGNVALTDEAGNVLLAQSPVVMGLGPVGTGLALDGNGSFRPSRLGPASVRLSPEQLVRPIRRWDWALALLTFAVTVLVFVLTLYDDDFGTWEDYAKAFTAGLGGQVGGAALWNLFPALRSYRLQPKLAK